MLSPNGKLYENLRQDLDPPRKTAMVDEITNALKAQLYFFKWVGNHQMTYICASLSH